MTTTTTQTATGRLIYTSLIRLGGLPAVLAGLCYVIVGIFHPENAPASVTTSAWAIVHVIACVMCIFAVMGMTGLYAR